MAPRIFLTGATGFIGGTIFQTLVEQHPDYDISILQRNPKPQLSKQFPNVEIVQGTYDDLETVTQAASCADIVVHNGDTDHKPCLEALVAGILKRSSTSPGYLIQLSGTGIISDFQSPTGDEFGNKDPRIWSDLNDIDELWGRPDDALHRDVDKVIQNAYTNHGDRIRTAIVCGPDIYGRGTGPGKRVSILIPFFVEEILSRGRSFYCGKGENTRSWVHVQDLVTIHLRLIEDAVSGGKKAHWNERGYYFASSQELSHLQLVQAVAKVLVKKRLITHSTPRQLTVEQLKEMRSGKFGDTPEIALFMLASSSRTAPDRSRKVLSYESSMPTLLETLDDEIENCLEHRGK